MTSIVLPAPLASFIGRLSSFSNNTEDIHHQRIVIKSVKFHILHFPFCFIKSWAADDKVQWRFDEEITRYMRLVQIQETEEKPKVEDLAAPTAEPEEKVGVKPKTEEDSIVPPIEAEANVEDRKIEACDEKGEISSNVPEEVAESTKGISDEKIEIESSKSDAIEENTEELTKKTTDVPESSVDAGIKAEEVVKETEAAAEISEENMEIAPPEDVAEAISSAEKTDEGVNISRDIGLITEIVPVAKSKQSNNSLTKVKQSLVKAKKAIIGKSRHSKAPSSERKVKIKA